MRYQGRIVDAVALWEEYVEFPSSMRVDDQTVFLPLVVCPNPDHDTNKRHFQINIRDGLVHCFAGCGISGTFEHAIAMCEGITRRQARKAILMHSRIGKAPVRKKRDAKKTPEITISLDDYSPLPASAIEYLRMRGITDASIAKWQLRWDVEELRIVIPVFDQRGRIPFVIKRAVREKDQPKYLYWPEGCERTAVLFGLDKINPGMIRSDGIVLVEGSIDAILNHQNGITNTAGVLGSRLSEIQAQMIANARPRRIITMFDADSSGIGATISVRKHLRSTPIKVVKYPKGKTDPAELSQKEAQRAYSRAVPYVKFQQSVTRLISTKEREKVGNAIP